MVIMDKAQGGVESFRTKNARSCNLKEKTEVVSGLIARTGRTDGVLAEEQKSGKMEAGREGGRSFGSKVESKVKVGGAGAGFKERRE
jgi:hypothetical protein